MKELFNDILIFLNELVYPVIILKVQPSPSNSEIECSVLQKSLINDYECHRNKGFFFD